MRLHIAARLHAFAHGLFRPKSAKEIRKLFDQVQHQFEVVGLIDDESRTRLIIDIASDVAVQFGLDGSDERHRPIHKLTQCLFDYEGLFELPIADWSKRHTIAGYWEIRDALTYQQSLVADFEQIKHLITQLVGLSFQQLYKACPSLYEGKPDSDGITVETSLLTGIGNLGAVTDALIGIAHADDLTEAGLFGRLQSQLERNIIAASGGNPNDVSGFGKQPKLPEDFDAKTPQHLIETYLGSTPLADIFDQTLPFCIPTKTRFEHHHIVAGSGHGKTQTLQYLIAQDLEGVAKGERSIVVIDSQGDLISNISKLSVFARGGPLHDRIVIIDPTDVEYPISLNLFDVGVERMAGYAPLERERLTNSILELYDFVLGSLLDAEMTQKQNVIFRYVTRLMLHIPDATIHTLRELMEPGAEKKFAGHIAKLSGTARHFFDTEFASKEFEQTKSQVLRRLWGILENQTFERMFSHPRSKLQLYEEMNAGKVILINTAKDLLKETGTQIFGRFFIAMIAQAAQERAVLPTGQRKPTFVYIDEAADYFDQNVQSILEQARKYNVGMVLAHQYLGQLDMRLEQAFDANTSIKFAGGVSAKDAKTLSGMMRCDASLIESQPKGSFASHVRGIHKGALPLRFPFGVMEDLPRMSSQEQSALRDKMRERYAVHYSELVQPDSEDETAERVEAEAGKTQSGDTKPKAGHIDTDAGDSW